MAETGIEYTVWYQKQIFPADVHLLSLRSPRHHIWSLFTECKYDEWGQSVTKGTSFPRSGKSEEDDMYDFDKWLDHFANNGTDNYGCYHPANYQSRALTAKLKGGLDPHGVAKIPVGQRKYPSFSRAISIYSDYDWVGLTEFFHESQCLLYYRLNGASIGNYIEKHCRCPREGNNTSAITVTHHKYGHRQVLRTLPAHMLQKISTLSGVDVQVYRYALYQFLKEIVWLESPAALNRTIVCISSLHRSEGELFYLGVNVSSLYRELQLGNMEKGNIAMLSPSGTIESGSN